jgi:hypothetical protein
VPRMMRPTVSHSAAEANTGRSAPGTADPSQARRTRQSHVAVPAGSASVTRLATKAGVVPATAPDRFPVAMTALGRTGVSSTPVVF